MTNLADLFPAADLQAEIDAGYVTRKQHPELPISIYTYTERCQFEPHWTPVTMTCRGLIADDDTSNIIALPFPKIFATGMHGVHDFAPPLPVEPFEIYDKADGSLAICYWYAGRWRAASKGSFISDQARWAQGRLDRADLSLLDPEITYLAEAIYPANRIVLDYGGTESLMLLAAFRPSDRSEVPLSEAGKHWAPIDLVVPSWGLGRDLAGLEALAAADTTTDGRTVTGTQQEGYVIRFASGQRAKIKLAAYLVLHRLYTGTNERTVWEVLASGQDPAVLYDQVPDEFAAWVRNVVDRLRGHVDNYTETARTEFDRIGRIPDRKAFAEQAVKSGLRAALFRLYDGRSIEELAWKSCKPRGDTPFVTDEEG